MISVHAELPLQSFVLQLELQMEGSTIALLGHSGAGKTSLLELIAGLRRTAKGRICLDGDVLQDTETGRFLAPERRRIGYVPQEGLLFPHLDVEQNLRFGAASGDGAKQRLEEITQILAIGALLRRYPASLSGGEKQRVALGRALATSPRLLLLDEPLAAMDHELKERVLPYLLRVREAWNIPMVYVTHHLEEAKALADEVVLMEHGRVIQHGGAAQVLGPAIRSRLDSGGSLENLLDGRLEGSALRVGSGMKVWVPASQSAGERAVFTVRPEDVLVSLRAPEDLSARNALPGEVVAIHEIGPDVVLRIDVDGFEWLSKLTRVAAQQLGVTPGVRVFVVVKTHSFRRLS